MNQIPKEEEKKASNFSLYPSTDRMGAKSGKVFNAADKILEKVSKVDSKVFLQYIVQRGGE